MFYLILLFTTITSSAFAEDPCMGITNAYLQKLKLGSYSQPAKMKVSKTFNIEDLWVKQVRLLTEQKPEVVEELYSNFINRCVAKIENAPGQANFTTEFSESCKDNDEGPWPQINKMIEEYNSKNNSYICSKEYNIYTKARYERRDSEIQNSNSPSGRTGTVDDLSDSTAIEALNEKIDERRREVAECAMKKTVAHFFTNNDKSTILKRLHTLSGKVKTSCQEVLSRKALSEDALKKFGEKWKKLKDAEHSAYKKYDECRQTTLQKISAQFPKFTEKQKTAIIFASLPGYKDPETEEYGRFPWPEGGEFFPDDAGKDVELVAHMNFSYADGPDWGAKVEKITFDKTTNFNVIRANGKISHIGYNIDGVKYAVLFAENSTSCKINGFTIGGEEVDGIPCENDNVKDLPVCNPKFNSLWYSEQQMNPAKSESKGLK